MSILTTGYLYTNNHKLYIKTIRGDGGDCGGDWKDFIFPTISYAKKKGKGKLAKTLLSLFVAVLDGYN